MGSLPQGARSLQNVLHLFLAFTAGLCGAGAAGAGALGDRQILADEPAIVDLKVAALILSGQEGGEIPMAVTAFPRSAGERSVEAGVVVEIDGPGLLAGVLGGQAPQGETAFEIYIYGLGGTGDEVLDQMARRVAFDWNHHPELLATGVKITTSLRLPRGESLVRVLVRQGDALGLRSTRLSLPDDEGESPRVVGLSFPDDRRWLTAALVAEGSETALPPPSDTPPAGLPLLTAGAAAEARLVVHRPPPDPWSLRASWTVEGDGQTVERTTLVADPSTALPSLGGDTRAGETPFRTARVAFDVPELAEGRYRLAAQLRFLRDGTQVDAVASEPVTVYVERNPRTPDDAEAFLDEPGEPGGNPVELLPRKAVRKIESRYLEILGRLAKGDRDRALSELRALERGAVESLAELALTALEQGQSRAFASLPPEAWESALPVILLHAGAVRAHGRDRRPDLRQHAARMTVALAEAYAERSSTESARRDAARILGDTAAYFLEIGSLSRAETLLRRATALQGDEPGILLALASLHEKRGHPRDARLALEGLIGARPAHPEGRLRLALNLRRTDAEAEARQLLEGLLEEVPGWVALLAHQELARDLAGDDLDRGRAILQRGLRRWPGHPGLTLQLAHLEDRAGERRTAAGHLAALGTPVRPASRPGNLAERSRYNRWPLAALTIHRGELEERAGEQLEGLARVLRTAR